MIKHALISQEEEWLQSFLQNYDEGNQSEVLDAIYKSVQIKNNIILEDPEEKGIRKALNFGHTIGHAFESF